MTKNDLKSGMLVELGTGESYLVYITEKGNFLASYDKWADLADYTKNMECSHNITYNINKVYEFKGGYSLPLKFITIQNRWELIWERSQEETIEIGGIKYSKSEIENRLKDLKPIK